MPNRAPITKDTYIRHLPFSHMKHICNSLDPGRLWEKFIIQIPKYLNSDSLNLTDDDFEPRYTFTHISLFERFESPTQKILNDWATQNPTLEHLLSVLIRSQLYQAADHLSVKVLNQGTVPRLEQRNSSESTLAAENFIVEPPLMPNKNVISQVPPHNKSRNINANIVGEYEKHYEKNIEEISDQSLKEQSVNRHHAGELSLPNKSDLTEDRQENGEIKCSPDSNSTPYMDNEKETAVQRPFSLPELTDTPEVVYEKLKHITNNFDERELKDGGRVIGKGGFGTVFLGILHDGKNEIANVAIKCLLEDKEEVEDQFKNELTVLSKYRHVNLVSLLGFSCEKKKRCLIYDYMLNGSLEDRLMLKDKSFPLNIKKRIEITVGTARGIVFLNNKGIIHRDIKSANVLLDENFVPKIGDFATARVGPSGCGKTVQETSLVIGTPAYLAPEAIQYDVSAKLDSYSFGVIILEILTSLPVFDNSREDKDLRSHIEENCDEIMDFVDKGVGQWDSEIAHTLYDIAKKCYAHSKKKRVTTVEVLPQLEKLQSTCH